MMDGQDGWMNGWMNMEKTISLSLWQMDKKTAEISSKQVKP